MASCGRGGGVPSDGLANAFAVLAPFEVIGALGMALFFAAYEDVIRFDAAVSRDDDGTESQTLGSLDALGEIDFFVHLTATFGFRYHRRYHSLSSYSKQRNLAERGGFE